MPSREIHRLAGGGLFLAGCLVLVLILAGPSVRAQTEKPLAFARVLEIKGPIGPPLADYILDGINTAEDDGASLIILEMDTPGGLDASMRRIIKQILSSSVPVATYVFPSGARAASAGTYILYASHIAAMTPSTNLGAATPIQLGGSSPLPLGEPEEKDKKQKSTENDDGTADKNVDTTDEEKKTPPALSNEDSHRAKVINDSTAYIKGLAELRGRNAQWAVKAVREAASLTAREAKELNVIDIVAHDLPDLLEQAEGMVVLLNGEDFTVHSKSLVVERDPPGWSTRFLAAITDPNVAFLLMTIGFYGLFFELANPGSVLPGTFGVIALVLGLYALSVLPVSMAGAALLFLGLAFMIAEAFVPSFGALGLGGLAAFALGATMLFDTKAPGFTLSWQTIASATILTGAFVTAVIAFALKSQFRTVTTGTAHLLNQTGRVESWDGTRGWVLVGGERWRATSTERLVPNQNVKITGIDGLTLTVQPV